MSRRLVPDRAVSVERIDRMCHEHGWQLARIVPESDEVPFEKIWVTPDGATHIHYVVDGELDVGYLTAEGDGAEAVRERIEASLPIASLPELCDAFERARDEGQALVAIERLGVAAPEQAEERSLACFLEAFEHASADVRLIAAIAAGYPRWPELREPLAKLARADPDADVRETAAVVLDATPAS